MNNQRGSIFFYILLGVVLFSALAYTVSRTMRSQSADSLTARKIDLAVSELLDQAQVLSRGVDKLRQYTMSESDLCFDHEGISAVNKAAYSTVAACSDDRNKLYHLSGAGVPFFAVPEEWLDAAHGSDQGFHEWMFTGGNAVKDLGESATNLDRSVELIAHVNHLKKSICEAVNKQLGITGIPDNSSAFKPNAPYNGIFAVQGQISAPELAGKKAGCFQNTNTWNNYIFYTVIMERD